MKVDQTFTFLFLTLDCLNKLHESKFLLSIYYIVIMFILLFRLVFFVAGPLLCGPPIDGTQHSPTSRVPEPYSLRILRGRKSHATQITEYTKLRATSGFPSASSIFKVKMPFEILTVSAILSKYWMIISVKSCLVSEELKEKSWSKLLFAFDFFRLLNVTKL
jgi:hypothetical protein